MNSGIFHALKSAMLSVCLIIVGALNMPVHGQVILHVHGDEGFAIQSTPPGQHSHMDIGSAWDYPYKYLQDALARASTIADEFNPVEIWVAATDEDNPYRPHMCSEYHAFLQRMDDPDQEPHYTCHWFGIQANWSFHLQNNVRILGGFPPDSADEKVYGTGGANENDRNWEAHTTVLSGDLDGNSPVNHDSHFREQQDSARAATLLATALIDETALIDGFTIQSSRASAFIAIDARPRVLGCIFASSTRASTHLLGESVIVFHRCRFESPVHEPIQAEAGAEVHCLD